MTRKFPFLLLALSLSFACADDEKARDVSVDDLRRDAASCLENADYQGALRSLDQLVRRDSKDAKARLDRGFAREHTGAVMGALEDYDAAVALGEKRALLWSADLRIKTSDLAAAEKDLQALTDVELHGSDRVAQLTIVGTLRLKQGNPRLARPTLERACDLAGPATDRETLSHGRDAHYNAASACYELSDFQAACDHMENYRRLSKLVRIELSPADYAMLCLLHYLVGERDEARPYLEKAPREWREKAARSFDDPAFFVGSDTVAPVKS